MLLRLIGDIHCDLNKINNIKQSAHKYDLTIQIGDFGVGFGAEYYLKEIDSDRVKILAGNHDNYNLLSEYPHNLGRFGVLDCADKKIFFVCGAWSIDQAYRTPNLSWWSNEELSFSEANDCLDLWDRVKDNIDLVISHDGPINVTQHILGSWPRETTTGKLLYEMWKTKEPSMWRFGHWHKKFSKQIGHTEFRCLEINEEEILTF
jgi:hypothetical protein